MYLYIFSPSINLYIYIDIVCLFRYPLYIYIWVPMFQHAFANYFYKTIFCMYFIAFYPSVRRSLLFFLYKYAIHLSRGVHLCLNCLKYGKIIYLGVLLRFFFLFFLPKEIFIQPVLFFFSFWKKALGTKKQKIWLFI